jgi:hypothetical protein
MEVEANGTLPFLDALITKLGPKLAMEVYRKPTPTGPYLHFKSSHPHSVKRGDVHSLLYWAKVICQNQKDFNNEIKNIRHDLMLSEYPKNSLTLEWSHRQEPSLFRHSIPGHCRNPLC